jgi:hypothetical protein
MRSGCHAGMCSTQWMPVCAGWAWDVIDLLNLHKEDHATSLTETVRAPAS